MHNNRRDAKINGDKFYITGKDCCNGHLSKRQTTNGCCYQCSTERNKIYITNNPDKRKKYRKDNADRIKRQAKEYSLNNKDKRRKYLNENRDVISSKISEYYQNNKSTIKKYRKEWYENNRDKYLGYSRKRYQLVKDDPNFRITKVMRYMVQRSLDGGLKSERTSSMVGYSSGELISHIESLFTDNMTWCNYGEWHIDHIIPISWWLSQEITDPSIINSMWNLQPLWAKDNLSKGAKI